MISFGWHFYPNTWDRIQLSSCGLRVLPKDPTQRHLGDAGIVTRNLLKKLTELKMTKWWLNSEKAPLSMVCTKSSSDAVQPVQGVSYHRNTKILPHFIWQHCFCPNLLASHFAFFWFAFFQAININWLSFTKFLRCVKAYVICDEHHL